MDTAALKKFAPAARTELIDDVAARLAVHAATRNLRQSLG